ncbi:CRE-DYS-1 protein [Caenorhabditis remanei]|uniref:CRE-DYS-1 protein n=1 Tax=Caenorhabditis remanei TaxID=31234 RepID=E3MYR8_CAERE|nr:CRE-DYS-1 protein [Caenorhabditis remanei]
MLFSGASTAKPKKDEKKDKKSDREEKYELQEQVFIRWANHLLGTDRLTDYKSLQDGSNAIFVYQAIIGQTMAVLGNPSDDWPNILQYVGDSKTNPQEVMDGQQKAVLSAWWQLVQFFWKNHAPLQLREEKSGAPAALESSGVPAALKSVGVPAALELAEVPALSEAIKQWCIEVMSSYEEIDVYDFTSSFRDGHAFNYLIHSYDKKLINLSKTAEMSAIDRIENAFGVAEKTWNVPRLLSPKDLHSEHLDSHSVLCYLMNLYLAMISTSKIENELEAQQIQQQKAAAALLAAHKMQSQPSTSSSSALQIPPQTPPISTAQQAMLDRGKSFEQQSVESEVRSRKSSSSSQKSGKSKKMRREEQLAEFKSCIEQVLTWLLEAEDELATLTQMPRVQLASVRSQFSDFESFMSSLTDSQDTVGRVLLRGQMLSNKSENEEEKEAIAAKLHLVNTRWEALREQAMQEQAVLQQQIHLLQQGELDTISQWLDATELEIESFGPLASDSAQALRQIELHTKFQQKLNDFQETIDKLESFVAVVDEENDASVATLEDALSGVSVRWGHVCEWAEKRAAKLDGLADLIDRTNEVFENLSDWLSARENELMTGLKSAHHLESEQEVAQQVRRLQKTEEQLEQEHSSFVRLSQLSCELVGRLDESNGAAANTVRLSLDSITQRWDNLVARIEEHGKTLVKSGKADVKQVMAQDTGEPVVTSSEGLSTDTEGEEQKNQLVDKFLLHISKLSHELEPLQEWSERFEVSRKRDDVRKMMNTCQEKLIQIKEQEARVNRLQLELEHLHVAKLNAKQLKRANDAFEQFAKGWARIVTKISEAMNVLTGQEANGGPNGEEAAVAAKIEQWIEAVDKVINELSQLPVAERLSRIDKLEQQLQVQEKNVGFVEKDLLKKAILKKGLEIAGKRLAALKIEEKLVEEVEAERHVKFTEEKMVESEHPESTQSPISEASILEELDGAWSPVGDVISIEQDLLRAQKAVEKARNSNMSNETVEKAETRKAEMEEKRRVTMSARSKFQIAEETVEEIERSLDRLQASDLEIADLVRGLEQESTKLADRAALRKEAERTAEKMLSMDDVEIPAEIVIKTKDSIEKLAKRWNQLDLDLEDNLRKARKDQDVFIQKRLREGEEALNEIKSAIESKRESLDAETAAESLDHLESSLDNISSLFGEIGSLPMDENSRQKLTKLAEAKDEIAAKANEALAHLSRTVSECEDFEKQIMLFQNWSVRIGFLLQARKSADISAFDIPHEYHEDLGNEAELIPKLSREFEEWSAKLKEMNSLAMEKEDAVRMREQLDHANDSMTELRRKFNEFKRPKGFEEKLEKVLTTLSNVEMGLDDTTGIDGAECGGALMEVRALVRMLDGAQEKWKDLTETREQLIKDHILDEESSRETLQKLQYAKTKSKELYERSSTCIERLEDCVEMYQRLKMESDEIERFLEEMETRLDRYAASDRPEEAEIVDELISEWNRNEAAMNNAAHLQRQLNERAIKIADDVLSLKRLRADALKNRLNSWCRTIQEMSEDDESALLEIDELHHTIEKELQEVSDKEPAKIAEKLRFLRADRDRLSSRTRKLAAKNPRLAATSSDVLEALNQKWKALEEKSSRDKAPEQPLEHLELRDAELSTDAPFDKRVEELFDLFKNLETHLDFNGASPVATVDEYQKRVDDLDLYLDEYRPPLDDVIEEGRKIAQTGRLELQTHAAIEKLDELANKIERVETELDRHREKVAPLLEQHEQLKKDIDSFLLVLDVFTDRNLDDVDIAKSTRKELAERDSHITSLTSRATAIHCALPGKGPQLHDTTLDKLRNRIESLEARLATTEKRAEPNEPKPTEPAEPEAEKSSPDRTSRSSLQLAMEAYGTATEDDSVISEAATTVANKDTVAKDTVASKEAPDTPTLPVKQLKDLEEEKRTIILPDETEKVIETTTKVVLKAPEAPPTQKKTTPTQEVAEVSTSEVLQGKPAQESIERTVREVPVDVYEETANISSGDELDTKLSPPVPDSDTEIASMFEVLDSIEDAHTNFEEFPFDYLDNAEHDLKKTLARLESCERTLAQNEMTINIVQAENARRGLRAAGTPADISAAGAPVDSSAAGTPADSSLILILQLILNADSLVDEAERYESDQIAQMDRKSAPHVLGELRKRVSAAEGPVIDLVKKLSQLVPRMQDDSPKSQNIRRTVYGIEDRFRRVSQAETAAVSKALSSALTEPELKIELAEMMKWCELAEKEASQNVNSLDGDGLEKLDGRLAQFTKELQENYNLIKIEIRVVQVLTETATTIADCHDLPTYLIDEMNDSGGDTTESRSTVVEMTPVHAKQSSSSSSNKTPSAGGDSENSENEDGHTLNGDDEQSEEDQKIYSRESSSTLPRSSAPQTGTLDPVAVQLTHTRHWLHDVERDASNTVDLAEWQPARELWQNIQGIIDEIRLRSVQVTGAHDASPNRQVRQQAAQLLTEMRRTIENCEKRCLILNQISDVARQNESARNEMEAWLKSANDVIGERRVEELAEDVVRHELQVLERVVAQLNERKDKMQDINTQAHKIVDTYTKDEAHNLSHLLSRLNMSWTKFNDNIRIRRAVLEASLRSRRDFHSALSEFEMWLGRQEENCSKLAHETMNAQAIKDTSKRKNWTTNYKTLNAELNAHEDVMKSVESMGKMLVESLESGTEKAELQKRVGETSRRWAAIRKTTNEIGERLEKAEQEWEKLSDGLADLLSWIETKKQKIVEEQPIGGSLSAVMQQSAFVKTLQREMESKNGVYKSTVADAHSFLMQHDLRPKLHSPHVLDDDYEEGELADLEQRRRGLEINANCEKLKKNWAELGVEVESWDKLVQHAMQRLQELERNLAECQLHLTSSENEIETMKAVEKIHLEDLKIAREETDQISKRIDEVRLFVDDVNDAAARLLAEDLKLDEHAKGQIEHVNKRYSTLKRAIRIRQAAVRNAASDFGPTSEHFLNQSVTLPWQRAISKSNLLPYYIEQTTEKTQWEHPVWVEIVKELSQFNRVKFLAYRTAMKLRALQKRLCLDLVDLPLLEKAFVRLKGLSAEECPGLEGMVCALLPMYEALHAKYPNQVQSVSLAVDIAINFLLNLFDQSRDGIMRVLSFKIAMIVFSNIPIEEKYRYLFKLVSQDGHATQKQIALLLYDLIHIPRLVGESAAFGGTNVEPSVRSCFETVRLAPTISEGAFIDWVKKEPQSIVWLAVMHRLVISENTKHASKCNVCKMFPIIGIRYRCLTCFNCDLCQNCFFSQRTAKNHKMNHPMQEYCEKTTSSDDARDFAKMLRNKLRASKRQKGYLPIDVAEEGIPLTCPPAKVTNQSTEQMNADTAQMTAHLAKLSAEHGGGAEHMEPVQSPLQIINQVEQLQRDEMDQMLHRLQVENKQLRKELEWKRGAASTMEIDRSSKRQVDRRSESRGGTLPLRNGRSVVSLKSTQSQNDVMDEAKALRLHKQRLEHRSRILEQQNEQLEMQLQRLKKVIDAQKQAPISTNSLLRGSHVQWTPERALSTARSGSLGTIDRNPNPVTDTAAEDSDDVPRGSSVGQMQNLMNACDDLGRAMESLVVSVVYDSDEENED